MQNLDLENENGRSMIEMLGVLAIIGVLSVGGIAGYSKAMQKYRINKAIEQITLIAGNVRTFFASQRSYEGFNSNRYTEIVRKAKLIPEEMREYNANGTFKQFSGVFGKFYYGEAHKSTNTDQQAFYLGFELPPDEDVCIELMSYDWTSAGVRGISAKTVGPAVSGGHKTVPVGLDDALSACSTAIAKAAEINIPFAINFYFDVNSNCWNETNGNTCS